MSYNINYDKWLTTPPDEEEAKFCESCNEEMELRTAPSPLPDYWKCTNEYCPDKFDCSDDNATAYWMAMELVEAKAEIEDLKRKLKLTQSQKGE